MPSHHALRRQFIDFFAARGHTEVPSSALVPHEDPSLMFVNAGMVQFKDTFLGHEQRSYQRAVSCQKCMRVSGKHNDLEEVGRTARHHTLFEMLGNFSFGDYFKEEAMVFAWEFVTKTLGLPKERLYITTFGGEDGLPADDEAMALWRKISGLKASQLQTRGRADNFWSMGDTGPCGPCSEIYFDQGEGPVKPEHFETGRVMEIWNNVFMQYNRGADGQLSPLPRASVDTGMGLERVLAVLDGADSNYHTDIFMPLIDEVAALSGQRYGRRASESDVSMRVIADHARALTFLVADGVAPSNEGRGYVLRRIVRRAIRHGRRLGLQEPFLGNICQRVCEVMGGAYPELNPAMPLVTRLAEQEEITFGRTLDAGLKLLADGLKQVLGEVRSASHPTLSGEVAFKLYDTFGFPKDLTDSIAEEQGIEVDQAGFDRLMQAQQERSRSAGAGGQMGFQSLWRDILHATGPSNFIGYPQEDALLQDRPGTWRRADDALEAHVSCRALVSVPADVSRPETLPSARAGQTVDVVLDPMPLYGEGGGQVGDTGVLTDDHGLMARVVDTWRPHADLMAARVVVDSGELRVDGRMWAGYGTRRRQNTRAHHSATHLLHKALRDVLGTHVKQAGSLVAPSHLRFDFTHFAALTPAELLAVEDHVNHRIDQDAPITTRELSFDAAQREGAMALFGEKYGEQVRVITMGDSIELCGGTHAAKTGGLGLMLVQRDQAVKAGVRRIEAFVADPARTQVKLWRLRLGAIATSLGATEVAQLLTGHQAGLSEDDLEGVSVRSALDKALSRLDRGLAATGGTDSVRPSPQGLGITVPRLLPVGETSRLEDARALRATWQAVSAMLTGRLADAPALLQELGDADVGHLAAAVLGVLSAAQAADHELLSVRRLAERRGAAELMSQARAIGPFQVITHILEPEIEDPKAMADNLRQALGSGIVCLAQVREGRVMLLVALTPDLTHKLSAGDMIRQLAPDVGGKGGGRRELAQAGGRNADGILQAFRHLESLLLHTPAQ